MNTSGAPGKVRARSVIVVARSQIGSALTAGKGSGFSSFTFFAVGAALFIVERYLNGFFEMSLRIVFGCLPYSKDWVPTIATRLQARQPRPAKNSGAVR